MSQPKDAREDPDSLRHRAEEVSWMEDAHALKSMPAAEAGRLLHELRVHQIELEMQNEELRRAQAELDAARARYFDLYDLAPVGYITVSEKGLILEANLTMARLLGLERGALIHQRFTSFLLQEDADIFYLQRQEVLRTGHRQASEMRLMRSDGAPFWARLEAVAAEDAEYGEVFRVTISDITVRKVAEARLVQAQKMESVGLLAGGVAHDFNNLLTVINGYSWLMLNRMRPGDPLRRDLEAIHKAGQSAAALTQQLLAYGRKQVLQLRLVDLNRLVSEICPLLERLAGVNVEVSAELKPEAGMVRADPHQLEQVLINLVLNARDAMPDGGRLWLENGVVEWDASYVESHPDVRPGRYVMLAVSDNGMGMNEATRVRVFEPFFTTKEVGKGTGLGLSTVQGIVAQSGGYVEVSSTPGHGATFRIYLPIAVEEAAGAPGSIQGPAGTETVLVVEDQAAARDFVAKALRAYGYRVIQADSGVAALTLCEREQERIDLVLTDLVMPEVSGRELSDQLKRSWPKLKVLFMSGYAGFATSQQAATGEISDFIQKPFSPEQLAIKIRAMLDRKEA